MNLLPNWNDAPSRHVATQTMLFATLSLFFLCLWTPLNHFFPETRNYWLLLILFLLTRGAIASLKTTTASLDLYAKIALLYLACIALIGFVHGMAIYMSPAGQAININGLTSVAALKQEILYSAYYLIFPLMLLAQTGMLRNVPNQVILWITSSAGMLTAGFAIYQRYYDFPFMHPMQWGYRFNGLATDPNALALTCFLLLPFLVAGVLHKNKALRLFSGTVVIMSALALWLTANRTALAGLIMAGLVLPVTVAIANRAWSMRARLILALSPVVLSLLAFIFAPQWITDHARKDYTASRIMDTWEKYTAGGTSGVFSTGEMRSEYFSLAVDLIAESPLAGWGPAGFYRESANMEYRQTGEVNDRLIDSALNHYLMLAGDFGIPVMLLNFCLITIPLLLGIVTFRAMQDDFSRSFAITLMTNNAIFLLIINTIPPSYFFGVLWLWSMQLSLLVSANSHFSILRPRNDRSLLVASIIIVLLLLSASSVTAFGGHAYANRGESPWWTI